MRPIVNSVRIRGINSALSFAFRSVYDEIDSTLRFPKKIRLKDQRLYTAPSTILVAAKNVAQKF